MTFKAFVFGLLASFGFPWLLAIVVPFMNSQSPEIVRYEEGAELSGVFVPKRDGRVAQGSKVYGQEGCATCHTQLIRPSYAGNDVFRDEWAGLRKTADHPDTRRETIPMDYNGERVAHIGTGRVGPDLSNLGRRLETYLQGAPVSPEEWLLQHLYNPRDPAHRHYHPDNQSLPENSTCPSKSGLFTKVDSYGAGSGLYGEERNMKPTDRAMELVSYLLSLKKDTLGQALPASLDFNPVSSAPAE